MRLRLGGLLLISAAFGCGDDAPVMTDAGCALDTDCDDGVWCNGDESCAMGVCQPGELRCDGPCDEIGDMCLDVCLTPDADGDGFDSLGCGGDDCDDTDASRYPGNTEICDADGIDEDCDPNTFGDLDVDGDGHVSATCCNGDRCGDDCADRLADVFGGATETCDLRDQDCDGNVDEGVAVMLFEDLDGDLFGDMTTVQACPGSAQTSTSSIDCEPGLATRHGAQLEVCDGLNNDCDDAIDEQTVEQPWYPDTDGDGFGDPGEEPIVACAPPDGYSLLPLDCDDSDGTLFPAASELCNARDDNCDGVAGYVIARGDTEDDDRDGFADAGCGGDDCDDEDPFNYPGGLELCDELDNDCDGEVDEMVVDVDWFLDADGDGFGDPDDAVTSCERQPGRVLRGGDCADGNPVIHPDVVERCNGVDDDCDGTVDEGGLGGVRGYRDSDGDGFGLTSDSVFACGDALPSGYVPAPGDCNDSDPDRFPTAADDCDGFDDDCDGVLDEDGALTWYDDGDDDGYGGETVVAIQCNQPGPNATAMGGDCNDADGTIVPMGVESCDGVDQDCDTRIDEGLPTTAYFPDGDGDGYALNTATAVMACGPEAGFTDVTGDCDDSDATVSPDGTEVCDGLDNDCNSTVDDTATTSLCAGGPNTTGLCQPPPAAPDTCECTDDTLYRDCDGAPFNGCEAVLATDSNNCGDCGVVCPTGQRCVSGSCAPSAIVAIDGGNAAYCVLRDTNLAYCWGGNRNFHLGAGSGSAVAQPSAFNTIVGGRLIGISENNYTSNEHSCQLVELDSGERDLRCWGHNQGGQLGIGTVTSTRVTSPTPIDRSVDDVVDDWEEVSVGGANFTLARTASGAVYSWGTNGNSFSGYLGRDTGGAADPVPALVTGVSGATAVYAGGVWGCAVVASGRVLCWGNAFSSQPAPHTGGGVADVNGFTPQPVRVIGVGGSEEDLTGAVELSGHRFGGCARMSDGRVFCWGNNSIGDGSATSSGTAVPALGVSSAVSLACGANACCAVVGTNVMCWGDNGQGQLGRGFTSTNELTPALVQTESGGVLSGIAEVAAANQSFCGRTLDHRVVCWGDGAERGNGVDAQTDRPHAGSPTYIEGI